MGHMLDGRAWDAPPTIRVLARSAQVAGPSPLLYGVSADTETLCRFCRSHPRTLRLASIGAQQPEDLGKLNLAMLGPRGISEVPDLIGDFAGNLGR